MDNIKRYKLVIIGNCHVGKTSLVVRYVNKQFSDIFRSTIGTSFFSKSLNINNEQILLEIWDTAGQERYRSLLPMYYRNSDIAYICFDLNNDLEMIDIFLKYWIGELNKYTDNINRHIYIIGTKLDETNNENIVVIEDFLKKNYSKYIFFKTSSKLNKGIEEMFFLPIKFLNDKKREKEIEKANNLKLEILKNKPIVKNKSNIFTGLC